MHLLIIADSNTLQHCKNKGVADNCRIEFLNVLPPDLSGADAIFYLLPEENLPADLAALSLPDCLVFVNAVCTTLTHLPANMVRINAWPGFINRPVVEVSASANNVPGVEVIFTKLGWQYQLVPDLPGFISARIIASIINEAYLAANEKVAEPADIDTAMVLGTNYPQGPFAWANSIGKQQVSKLLAAMGAYNHHFITMQ